MSLKSAPVLQKIKEKIAAADPDPAKRKVLFVYNLNITVGGNIVKTYTLDLKKLETHEGEDGSADATLTIDDEAFVQIGMGQLSQEDALKQGKLKLSGNPEAIGKFELLRQKYNE